MGIALAFWIGSVWIRADRDRTQPCPYHTQTHHSEPITTQGHYFCLTSLWFRSYILRGWWGTEG